MMMMRIGLIVAAASLAMAAWADAPLFDFGEGERSLWLTDAATGEKVFRFGNLSFQWAPQNATAGRITPLDRNGYRVELEFQNDVTGKCRGNYEVHPDGNRIVVDYTLNIPEEVTTDGVIFERFIPGGQLKPLFKSGIWFRHANGGVPYEAKGAVLRPFPGKRLTVWEKVDGNPAWGGEYQQHIVFRKDEKDPTIRHARVEFMVLPNGFDASTAAAVFNQQVLALNVTTAKPFHLFDVGEMPKFKLTVFNPSLRPADAELRVNATAYDGTETIRENRRCMLAPQGKTELSFTLPKAEQPDIWFIEAVGTVDGKETFLRSTVAAMDRHEFQGAPQGVFGISAFFPIPDRKSALELLRRIGVRHLRSENGNELRTYGMDAGYHSAYTPKEWAGKSPEEQEKRIREHIAKIKANGATHWEFGNENDFKKPEEAAAYVELLRRIRPILDAEAPGVKLLSIGFANGFGGIKSLDLVAQAGGWPLLDGIAYHLGRGNTVPDLENVGDGWFYLSSLQELEKLMKKHGVKPVYLTEIYTPTFPNTFWDDSLRNATENVPLSYAIALAHDVKIAHYYQLNDSVWFDIGGVNSNDREYSFGMLYRNGNVKPTLLAYQTAAKMLDAAKFEKKWKSGKCSKGYIFTKPDGSRVALLWDRTDGYGLNQKKTEFAGQEPWIAFWKTRTPVRLKCTGTEIKVINPIGQLRRIPAKNGYAEVNLSGEPIWVVGAEF